MKNFFSKSSRKPAGQDIIIDDGSHLNRHVVKSFQVLFPLLADDGIYVAEDTQTAYWPGEGGSSDNFLSCTDQHVPV